MDEEENVPGSCYGVWYSETDPRCRKCIIKSRCRSAALSKKKNDLNIKDSSVNAFLYLVGLLDNDIGDYEVVRDDFSVLYRFMKNNKSVCVFIISKFTKRVKVITRTINKIEDEIRTKERSDEIYEMVMESL